MRTDPEKTRTDPATDTAPVSLPPRLSHGRRSALLGVLAAILAVIWLLHDDVAGLISMKTLGRHYTTATTWVDANLALAIAIYAAAYLIVAVCFLPGSSLFVPVAGLMFGVWLGTSVAWLGSLVAATAAYLVARFFANRLLPDDWPPLQRVRDTFQRKAFLSMVALRLAPGVPFAVGNSAPAAMGVPYATFIAGSAIGLIPSRIAFGMAGAGMASILDAENARFQNCLSRGGNESTCPYSLSVSSLLTFEAVAALVALAILAFVPLLYELISAVLSRVQGSQSSRR